jgi:3-hydroxyacyl-[acyl-carrier-protein] dehydratase
MRLEYFQMLDRIVDLNIDERTIRAICTIPKTSPVFEGHFPGYPLMPGVLLIECMAQTTGWLASALVNFSGLPMLCGVKEAKLRSAVFPGDELEFEGKVVHEGSGYTVGETKGRRQGKIVCSVEITYRIVPYANDEFRQALRDWAERLGFPLKEFIK